MSGRLGSKISELPKHLSSHLLSFVVLGLFKHLLQPGIEILSISPKGEKPVQMIGAAAGVGDLLLGYFEPGGNLLQGGLYPVAEAGKNNRRRLAYGETV